MAASGVRLAGFNEFRAANKKLKRFAILAHTAALRKTAVSARGKVRRAIVKGEGVKLNTTRRRVNWFWKKKRRGLESDIKLWVGTKYRQFRAKKGEGRKIDITDTAQAVTGKLARKAMRETYPKAFKQQMTRKLSTFRQ